MSISRRAMVESLPDPPKRMSADAAARKFELQQPLAGGRIVSWRKLPLLRRVAGKPRKIRARTMHLQIFGDDVPSAVNGDANRDFNLATDRIARAARNGRNLFMRHRGCHGRRCYRGRRWRRHRGLLRGNRSCNGPNGAGVASQHAAADPDREQNKPHRRGGNQPARRRP